MTVKCGKIINGSEMSPTHLELRWVRQFNSEYPWRCEYNLVLALDKYDIRREIYGDSGIEGTTNQIVFSLGGCQRTGDWSPLHNNGQPGVYLPFRDLSHITWDSAKLNNLPMYVTCDGFACELHDDQP